MTNGESIRSMSDEDMLEVFCGLFFGNTQEAYTLNIIINEPIKAPNGIQMVNQRSVRMLDWLKEKVK